MPGTRDRNLRSGDLHEELGIFLLKAVALVAPVPRQEDVGNDAFVTLIRPEGSRRLIPDVSFLVQLKSASVASVSYTTPAEMAWIGALDSPLFIGRVDLKQARIELFTTLRLHQILLEGGYDGVELLLDPADGTSTVPNVRRANLGPAVHAWSMADVTEPDFLARSYAVLRPHVDTLRRNRSLRGIQSQRVLRWETSQPPTDNGEMMLVSPQNDIADTLRDMAPHARRLLMELQHRKRYGDFPVMLAFFDLMRRWGADPDPDGTLRMLAGYMGGRPGDLGRGRDPRSPYLPAGEVGSEPTLGLRRSPRGGPCHGDWTGPRGRSRHGCWRPTPTEAHRPQAIEHRRDTDA